MNNQSQQIKGTVAKIDISKIAIYSQTYPKSKTLRQIINYNQRVQTSNNEQEIFKLGANLAYYLDTICDPNKGVRKRAKRTGEVVKPNKPYDWAGCYWCGKELKGASKKGVVKNRNNPQFWG
ncbi:3117_t:CDS:2, partial [Funneliformis geosporum]